MHVLELLERSTIGIEITAVVAHLSMAGAEQLQSNTKSVFFFKDEPSTWNGQDGKTNRYLPPPPPENIRTWVLLSCYFESKQKVQQPLIFQRSKDVKKRK